MGVKGLGWNGGPETPWKSVIKEPNLCYFEIKMAS